MLGIGNLDDQIICMKSAQMEQWVQMKSNVVVHMVLRSLYSVFYFHKKSRITHALQISKFEK